MTAGGATGYQFLGSCGADGSVATPVQGRPSPVKTVRESTATCEAEDIKFDSIYTECDAPSFTTGKTESTWREQGSNVNNDSTPDGWNDTSDVDMSALNSGQQSAAYRALLRERLQRGLNGLVFEGHAFLCAAIVLNIPWVMFLILVNARIAYQP